MLFECAICLENIKYASVGSCMHHFCYFCLFNHCKFNNKCPMCKTYINEIQLDREFDQLINKDTLPSLIYPNETIINNYYNSDYNSDCLDSSETNNYSNTSSSNFLLNKKINSTNNIICPGLTIKNNTNSPGVVITKIKATGLFNKYNFKVNDVLLFINEIPCCNHINVMKQIMNLFNSEKPMKIIKL